MSSSPLVSIVIPCYNQAHLLGDAINSALAQTYPSCEIIVVDDGSTDDTTALASSYGGTVRVITQQNAGLSAARNAGISSAAGEFVLLLDSDDALESNCVESRIHHAKPDTAIVCGAFKIVDADLKLTKLDGTTRRLPATGFDAAVLKSNYGPPAGWLIRRDALTKVGLFDPLLKSCEDWDLLIRLAHRFPVAYDPDPAVLYRQLPNSMSRNSTVMYDAARAMFRKNRSIGNGYWRYRWNSFIGMYNHTRASILARLLKERGAKAGLSEIARLALKRPGVGLHMAMWLALASLNRLLLVFGRGPLASDRPKAA